MIQFRALTAEEWDEFDRTMRGKDPAFYERLRQIVRDRLGRSPDRSDALLQSFAFA